MSTVISKLNRKSIIGRTRRILAAGIDWLNRADGQARPAAAPKVLLAGAGPAAAPAQGLQPATVFPLSDRYSVEEAAELLGQFKEWNIAYRIGPLATVASQTMPGQGDERRVALRFDHIFSRLVQEFGGTLAGQSVLDIGCHDGFFSIQAKMLGAARVLGVDARPELVRQATLVRDLAGLDGITFQEMSILDLSPETVGKFDVVLCLGVLYHLSKPQVALERLLSVTGKVCVIDTHIAQGNDVLMRGIVENPGYTFSTVEPGGLVWFPTEPALNVMLRHAGFREMKTLPVLRADMPPDYQGDYEYPRITVLAAP